MSNKNADDYRLLKLGREKYTAKDYKGTDIKDKAIQAFQYFNEVFKAIQNSVKKSEKC
ncbi:21513_t:CDS:2 [Racocetra persica]|uniref:21513_t:CDS:1 n=1 Tax=Racocetra persica TaxID=160502 RepID=A0ACA9K922_9GLOM|nr:21513_t:CDS:2 [Racocetra persica]